MLPDEVATRVWSNQFCSWGGPTAGSQDGVLFRHLSSQKHHDDSAYHELGVGSSMREAGAKILIDGGPFPHVEKTRYVWTGSDTRWKGVGS